MTDCLSALFASGQIDLERGAPLDRVPAPLSQSNLADRIEGMLLGLAIGDALGNTTESMVPGQRRRQFGEIRDYLPNHYADGRPLGLPSDDSQLAFRTVEHLIECGELVPDRLADCFCGGRLFGAGSAVRGFIHAFALEGKPWQEAGQPSAGNGALMRIAPILLPHLRAPTPALWADTAVAAMITHNDRMSTGSCVAFVGLLWDLLGRDSAPESNWWLDTFLRTLAPLEGTSSRYESRVPGDEFTGSLSTFLDTRVRRAMDDDVPTLEACNSWYSGAFLLETVPSALMILAQHGDDAEEAIVRAVNDTRDNDTVAAIVGAAVGALHGAAALPERWKRGLLGRTAEADDGRIFTLIDQAKARFI